MGFETENHKDRRQAYSLLGLFDVNMPLLYGEGEKSFIRMQEEIMKYSNDHSLFAWTDPEEGDNMAYRGLLARSLAHFALSSDIIPNLAWDAPSTSYSMTNNGPHIELYLVETDAVLRP